MTLDELLLEWSYRSEKGYPELDNPSDISVLKQILEKLNLPSNTIIQNLKEAPFKGDTLKKRDNDVLFLNKINKGEEFELKDGSKIIIDPEKSAESIQKIQNKDFDTKNLIFTDTSGNTHRLTSFEKTEEFGGKPTGAGANTAKQESGHCYALGIAYYLKQGPIAEEDITKENFEQASQYTDGVDSIDSVFELFDRQSEWILSIVKSVNKIYELFPNKNYTFHRDSVAVERLYTAFNESLEKKIDKSLQFSKMNNNKWNPGDIWLFSPEVVDEDWSGNVAVLNGQIADYYEDGKLVGISLKKIGKKNDAIEKIYNDPNIEEKKYSYTGYKTTTTSKDVTILFDGGTATARMFTDGIKGFALEINGSPAQGGKAGGEAIDTILKNNGLTPLPSINDTIAAFEADDERYYNKFYYLYDRFIENISKEDFKEKYESSKDKDLKWIMGNYYGLELIERLEDNQPQPTNEILDDILRYAYSSTKDSSKFIKISE